MKDTIKFWLQTLLIPAVLAFIGYGINNTLSKKQREFDKIKFTEQILNDAFDSNNPEKALALTNLLPKLTEDTAFSNGLITLINNYYIKKLNEAALTGNDSAFRKIADAASTFNSGNPSITDSIKQNPVTSKAAKASDYEQKGLTQIREGNLDEAKKNFDSAEKTFSGFHSSYEISSLLARKISEVNNGNQNKNEATEQVMDTIRKKYAWKLNPAALKLVK